MKLIYFYLLVSFYSSLFSQEKWRDTILISDTASDRATHYLESNKIIENDSLIITTILEFEKDKYYNSVYKLNKKNKKLTKFSFPIVHKDNHSGAAINVNDKGYIIIVLGAHHESITTFISRKPWNIKEFDQIKTLDGVYTYPSLTIDNNNRIYLSLRETNYKNDWRVCLFVMESEEWKKVSNPVIGNYNNWLRSGDVNNLQHTKGYQNFSSTLRFDKNNRLHLLYRIFEFIPKNLNVDKEAISPYHKYGMSYLVGYTYSDNFGETWKSKNGEFLEKISPNNTLVIKGNSKPELTSSFFEISNLLLWKDEKPVFLIVERKKDKHIVWISILKDSDWVLKKINIPNRYIAHGKPRISIRNGYLTFVISCIEKKYYHRKETWGNQNNINLFGTVNLKSLKTKSVEILDIKPSWPGVLSQTIFDSGSFPPVLINNGNIETKSGNVYLMY